MGLLRTARPREQPALATEAMPGSVWFPGSQLNYAAEVFRGRDDAGTAVVAVTEDSAPVEVSWGELRRQVASVAASLTELGVAPGDRVVGYLPNSVEAIVAFLATVSPGAVWAVCGMDYTGSAAQRHECGGEGSDEVAVPPPLGRQDEDEGSQSGSAVMVDRSDSTRPGPRDRQWGDRLS
ncbi:AMP-binding protein [Streptomyces lydicus]|uniref:AMP-binding protein n=1 Tax=Streptomyces lydicus TaxID=47763 RepID=UPI0037A2D5D8